MEESVETSEIQGIETAAVDAPTPLLPGQEPDGNVPVRIAHYVTVNGISRCPGDEIRVDTDTARSLVFSGQARHLN